MGLVGGILVVWVGQGMGCGCGCEVFCFSWLVADVGFFCFFRGFFVFFVGGFVIGLFVVAW